jgi:hypothetical protein
MPPGAENQPALEGQQLTQINYGQRPVQSFKFRLQIGALHTLSEQIIDTPSLFCEQNRATRMAFALSQSLLRPLNPLRQLPALKAHRGVAIRILIEFPRDQFMHVNPR